MGYCSGRVITTFLAMVLLVLFSNMGSISGATYNVGDEFGWGMGYDYSFWTGQHQFYVGDVLVFYFYPYGSNVAEVKNEEEYTSCQFVRPATIYTVSPVRITLTSTGYKYYISAGDFCTLQRMIVYVRDGSGGGGGGGAGEDGQSPPSTPIGTGTGSGSDSGSGSSSSSNSSPSPPSSSSHMSGKIIGAIVGAVLAAIIKGLIIGYCIYRRNRRQRQQPQGPLQQQQRPPVNVNLNLPHVDYH